MKHSIALSFFLLLFSLIFATPTFAYDVEVDGIYYKLNKEDKTAKVTRNDGIKYSGVIEIPSTIAVDGVKFSVTSIGDGAFDSCTGLTSVTIPNSVTSFGDDILRNCILDKLYFDVNGQYFLGSFSLNELYIGDSVTIVYENYGYSGMKKISLGKKVSQIRANAFADSYLEEFTITGEEPPYCYPNIFGTQDLSNATLYVPESKTEYYMTTEPWSKFGKILTLSGESPAEPEKCAAPSISFENGKLIFTCETDGVKFESSISCADAKSFDTDEIELSGCYDIYATATKEGLLNSETTTAKLYWMAPADKEDNINMIEKRGVVIYSAGGNINISGLENNERVGFYDADGKSLGSTTAIEGSTFFSAKAGTVVLVKIGKDSIKVVVR